MNFLNAHSTSIYDIESKTLQYRKFVWVSGWLLNPKVSNFRTTQNSLAVHYKLEVMAKINRKNSIWVRTTKTTEWINSQYFWKTSLQMPAMSILHIFYKYVTICSVFVLYEKKMENQNKRFFFVKLGIFVCNWEKNILFGIGNGADFSPKIRW